MTTGRLRPQDEFLHPYPYDLSGPWKENYYFNFVDTTAGIWGINHFSINRFSGTATFRAFHVVDGVLHRYVTSTPWGDDVKVGDDRLRMSIIEPYAKQLVVFDDGAYRIELTFTPRFDFFDYNAHGRKTALETPGSGTTFDTEHYEQGVFVSGCAVVQGNERKIGCLGHRDHSWGYRDESGMLGWNWVAIQFKSATVNFFRLRGRDGDLEKGFISQSSGNVAIETVQVLDVVTDANGAPRDTRYQVRTSNGDIMTISATRFSLAEIPLSEAGTIVVYENFSDFVWNETGEQGTGIDEHLTLG